MFLVKLIVKIGFMLSFLFFSLFFTIFSISLIPQSKPFYLKMISLLGSGFILILSCGLLFQFNDNNFYFQNILSYSCGLEFINIYFILGLDGLSLLFFILSSFLIFFCIFFCSNEINLKFYVLNLLFLELFLLLVFSSLDLFFFYAFFEAILIPMFLLIGVLGTRARKIRAAYLLMLYTLIASLILLLGLLYIYTTTGTLAYEYLITYKFSKTEQYWLWFIFFFSFASKVPLFPFHIWLPEAHVEAPTIGSILLAGILLKLGVYGFIRFSLVLFSEASLFFAPLIYVLSLLGILYASFTALRQTDIKRIIAYSSIAHMNLVTIGIFSFTIYGLEGALIQSISHGFIASSLFLIIGILYTRYHSRYLFYYSGLVHMMPLFTTCFLILILANIAMPGTSSFIGEFLILLGLYKKSFFLSFLATLGVIFCGSYSLWLYNRICFGNLKKNNTLLYKDLSLKESLLLIPFISLIFLMVLKQMIFFDKIQSNLFELFLLIITI